MKVIAENTTRGIRIGVVLGRVEHSLTLDEARELVADINAGIDSLPKRRLVGWYAKLPRRHSGSLYLCSRVHGPPWAAYDKAESKPHLFASKSDAEQAMTEFCNFDWNDFARAVPVYTALKAGVRRG